MNKFLLLCAGIALIAGCTPDREVVDIIKGDPGAPGIPGAPGADGSSCSVADYQLSYEDEEEGESFLGPVLGAIITCTDGSSAIILNGENGKDGINGNDGVDGATGSAGTSCSATRLEEDNFVTIKCGDDVAYIYDGEDGDTGPAGPTGPTGPAGANISSILLSKDVEGKDAYCKKVSGSGSNSIPPVNGTCPSNYTYVPAIIAVNACTIIDGSNSAKLSGNGGEVKLYSTTDCSGSHVNLNDGEIAVTDNGNLLFNVSGSDYIQLLTFN